MRNRTITSAGLILAGALLFSGCSGSGGGVPTSVGDACAVLESALAEVSDNVESALSDAAEPSEVQASLEGFAESVDALAESAGNADVAEVLGTLSETLGDAAAKVATLPTDADGKLDAKALAEERTAIEDSVEKVNTACTENAD